jgi:protease-4
MSRVLLVAAVTLFLTGCFNGLVISPTNVCRPIEEVSVTPACSCFCRNKVAIIDVEGMILNAKTGGLFGGGDNPVSLFRERLDAAACDKRVKAVVVRINSPGGAVTASDIMYRDLLAFKEETHKPVVVCMMDVAASGGYYLAMAADCVYAHPSTVTGSIGVIMSLYTATGLLKLVGVKSEAITSGPNKDVGSPFREMTPQDRALFQGMVNSFYEQFVDVVAHGRAHCLSKEQVRGLADGRVYTGVDAKRLGLVDEVGYLEDAIRKATELAHVDDAAVVAYDRCNGYRGSIYAGLPRQIDVRVDVPGLSGLAGLAGPSGSGFLYVWEPGVKR